MTKVPDLMNLRFGRLVVVKRAENDKWGKARWICQCDCGNQITVNGSDLVTGRVKSCKCLTRERVALLNKTHGLSKTKIYKVWRNMKTRCYNSNNKKYKDYGARGITVCDEWKDNFLAFYEWSINNGYKEELPCTECTLDRINNDEGYFPNNCRWTTFTVQANNKRKNVFIIYNGEKDTIHNWCRKLNLNYETVRGRMRKHPEYTAEQLFENRSRDKDK